MFLPEIFQCKLNQHWLTWKVHCQDICRIWWPKDKTLELVFLPHFLDDIILWDLQELGQENHLYVSKTPANWKHFKLLSILSNVIFMKNDKSYRNLGSNSKIIWLENENLASFLYISLARRILSWWRYTRHLDRVLNKFLRWKKPDLEAKSQNYFVFVYICQGSLGS